MLRRLPTLPTALAWWKKLALASLVLSSSEIFFKALLLRFHCHTHITANLSDSIILRVSDDSGSQFGWKRAITVIVV
jgi:hypothetical protein